MMHYFLFGLLTFTMIRGDVIASRNNIQEIDLTKRIQDLEKNLNELKNQFKNHNGFYYKFGGRVKLDTLYDFGAKGSLYGLDPSTLPLKKIDSATNNHGHLNAGVSSSRLFAEVSKSFNGLQTDAYVEFDFAKDSSDTTASYSPRVRHLFTKVGGLLIGQAWYTFQDMDAFANTLDNLYGGGRQVMIRYSFKLNHNISLSVSGEKPNTQYITNNGSTHDNNQYGKSQLPDFASQIRFKHSNGHVAFSGVVRRLQIHIPKADAGLTQNYSNTQVGWGLGFTGRYNFYKENGFIWQINGGKGTGRYIDDFSNQDAYLQYGIGITPQFTAIKSINYIVGLNLCATDKLAITMAASITQISKPKTLLNVTTYNTNQQRYHANTIYDILPNSKLGFEIMHYTRRAGILKKRKGEDTRILTSFIYNF